MKNKLIALTAFTLFSTASFASSTDYHHALALFVGIISVDSKTESSYGIAYEHKFDRMWGAGAVFETSPDLHNGTDIILVSAYLHPWKGLRLGAGIGQETIDDLDAQSLTRVSLSYNFHVGPVGIAPTLAFDFVGGDTATVVGITIVKSF